MDQGRGWVAELCSVPVFGCVGVRRAAGRQEIGVEWRPAEGRGWAGRGRGWWLAERAVPAVPFPIPPYTTPSLSHSLSTPLPPAPTPSLSPLFAFLHSRTRPPHTFPRPPEPSWPNSFTSTTTATLRWRPGSARRPRRTRPPCAPWPACGRQGCGPMPGRDGGVGWKGGWVTGKGRR